MGDIVDKAHAAIGRVEALGELARSIFTRFDPERILANAREAESLVEHAEAPLPLAGKLVSVKDLFDEAGERTTAGSRLLRDRPAATRDSEAVARMKAAGAVMFGRTTMSEFAYSGVGLNPHHGTPGSALDAARIPGGSTSGGGVSVGLSLCDIALGTDTGGSIRIPSAINGLYGFKPSQHLVPRSGVHPLSQTLDSAGPLAATFEDAVAAFAVMSATTDPTSGSTVDAPMRLAIPVGAFVNALDASTADTFEATVAALRTAGHEIVELDVGFLNDNLDLNRIIVSAEAHALYKDDLDALETLGDPRVLKRIRFAETLSQADIDDAYAARKQVVARFSEIMAGHNALVAPTLQVAPPTIVEAETDFDQVNAAMLRNPSLVNLADGCALVMPVAAAREADAGTSLPGSLMIVGSRGADWSVLKAARALLPSVG